MNQDLPQVVRASPDVSDLPDAAMGPTSLVWWGTFGFMLIEGTQASCLAGGSLLYLGGPGRPMAA
jgi:cytochrome c oxidase subunit 3